MARASGRAGYGSGWHKQSGRHRNARMTGRAGGQYATRVYDLGSNSGIRKAERYKSFLEKKGKSPDVMMVGINKVRISPNEKESPAQKLKVERVLHEYKEGELKTSAEKKVTKHSQAVAIALNEAGISRKQKKEDFVDRLMRYESGEMTSKEEMEYLKDVEKRGLTDKLQGHYGREVRFRGLKK